ncbi:MAG: peptide chain release factor N(5)-glutamine methyltransferase [Acetobacter sp.]|nr:peptide chain release factor N(5)-glutamine methyltransferase [Acetobacter sp.]
MPKKKQITINTLIDEGRQKLHQAGVENPRREAKLLLQHAFGFSAEQMLAFPKDQVLDDAVKVANYNVFIVRRAQHEPFAYITAHKGFWTLDLKVSPASLIPRDDTESLILTVLTYFSNKQQALSVLDLGTGTGCLLLAILAEYPQAWGIGVDINPEAARLADENITRCHMRGRAWVIAGEWTKTLASNMRFDCVVSNPPYIPTADLQTLMPDVRYYEPRQALDGGCDGLEAYRVLCQNLSLLLKENGFAFLEIGIHQAPAVSALAQAQGLHVVSVIEDLAGIERVIVLQN